MMDKWLLMDLLPILLTVVFIASGCDGGSPAVDGDADADPGTVADGDLDMESGSDFDGDQEAIADREIPIPEECRGILQKDPRSNNCFDGKCAYALLEQNREFTTKLSLQMNQGDVGEQGYTAEELELRKGCLVSFLESADCTQVRSSTLPWVYARCGNWLLEEIVQIPVIRSTRLECLKGEWCSCLHFTRDDCFQNPFCTLVGGRELNKDLDCWEGNTLSVCRTNTEFSVNIDDCMYESYCVMDANSDCYSVSGCDYNAAFVDWNIVPECCAGWRDACSDITDGDVMPYTEQQCGDVQPVYLPDTGGLDYLNFESACHHIRFDYSDPYLTETCTVVSVYTTLPGTVVYCLPIGEWSHDYTVYSWPGPGLGCGIGTTSISIVPGWHAILWGSGLNVDSCVAAVNSSNLWWFTTRQKLTPTCEDSASYEECIANIDLPYYCQAQFGWPVEYHDGMCFGHYPPEDPDFSLDDGIYVGCTTVLPFSESWPVPPGGVYYSYSGLIRNQETGECLNIIQPFGIAEGAMPRGWEPADCSDCLPGE